MKRDACFIDTGEGGMNSDWRDEELKKVALGLSLIR